MELVQDIPTMFQRDLNHIFGLSREQVWSYGRTDAKADGLQAEG